jgi:hypothetical protein
LICDALQSFIDQEILARVGYAPKDVVKKTLETSEVNETSGASNVDDKDDDLIPTPRDMEIFSALKQRLAFMVKSDLLYDELSNVNFKKTASSFKIFYKKPNKGSIVSFHLNKENVPVFKFPLSGSKDIETNNFREISDLLLEAYRQRAQESGISVERTPNLRSVS